MKKIIFVLLLFSLNSAFAHPHLFIKSSATFVFSKNYLKGIQLKWVFDEMFSSSMIQDYDENGDGYYNKQEIKTIKIEAFQNLINFNYFTFIKLNNEKLKIKKVKNFNVKIKKKCIIYTFFIPLNIKRSSKVKIINFSSHDKSYYADIQYPRKKAISLTGISKTKYKYKIIDNTKKKYYNGIIAPREIHLKFWR